MYLQDLLRHGNHSATQKNGTKPLSADHGKALAELVAKDNIFESEGVPPLVAEIDKYTPTPAQFRVAYDLCKRRGNLMPVFSIYVNTRFPKPPLPCPMVAFRP